MTINKKIMYGSMIGLLTIGGVAVANMAFAQSNKPQQTFITQLAQALGISDQKLNDAIKKVESQNIDTRLSEGKITSSQASELKQKIANGQYHGFGMVGGMKHGERPELMQYLLTYLNMTKSDFMKDVQDGQTISTIITGKGKTVADAKTYLISQLNNQIQTDVKNGKLTQQEATDMMTNENTMIDAFLNNQRPKFHMMKMENDDNSI